MEAWRQPGFRIPTAGIRTLFIDIDRLLMDEELRWSEALQDMKAVETLCIAQCSPTLIEDLSIAPQSPFNAYAASSPSKSVLAQPPAMLFPKLRLLVVCLQQHWAMVDLCGLESSLRSRSQNGNPVHKLVLVLFSRGMESTENILPSDMLDELREVTEVLEVLHSAESDTYAGVTSKICLDIVGRNRTHG